MALRLGKIGFRFLFVISSIAILTNIAGLFFTDSYSKQFIMEDSFNALKALREAKGNQVESYFQQIEDQIVTFSEDEMIIKAMSSFKDGFSKLNGPDKGAISSDLKIDKSLNDFYQNIFIPKLNSNSVKEQFASKYMPANFATKMVQYLYVSSKSGGAKANFESNYSKTHDYYHPKLKSYLEKFGYYDIFLVEIESGNIVYSVAKEVDFGTSLLNGPYKDSKIAELFTKVKDASYPGFTSIVDYSPYKPSFNERASFIASPIYDGKKKVGVLIFQMPVGRINNIMTSNNSWKDVGLGASGETYLIGEDYTLRNQSRFLIESKEEYLDAIRKSGVSADVIRQIDKLNNSIGLQLVKTKGAAAALNGESSEEVFDDYRGVPVLSAYRPLRLNGLSWVILCEIDEAEALAPLQRLRIRFLIIFLISIPLVIVIAFYFSRSLTKRLDGLTNVAKEFANGNMDVALVITGKDEIGSLAASLGKMRDSIHDLLDKQEKTIEALSASLIPVSDDIGVMSLIGVFDEHRLEVVRRNITSELDARFRKVVILDLTGILEIDRSTGDGLFKITKAVKLMGSKVIITGVRPDMAIDLTELNIDSSDVLTETNLQSGIEKGMKLVAS